MSDNNDDRPVDATPDTSDTPATAEASAATPSSPAASEATDAAPPASSAPPVPSTPAAPQIPAGSSGVSSNPDRSSANGAPSVAAGPSAPASGAPSAAPSSPAQPAAPSSAAQPGAPSSQVQPAAPSSAAQPGAPSAAAPSTRPVAPGPVPPGYVLQAPGQPRPQAYAGQPHAGYAAPPRPQVYGGQPSYGGSFGRPADTQPTLPLGDVPRAPETAKKPKSGAGKVAGLIVAAALVGGAAGLGGSYAGLQLFAPSIAIPATGPGTVTVNNTDAVGQTTAIAAKVVPSVVTIAAASQSGSGTGSGVVLTSDGYVVTNTHVVTLDGATGGASVRVTTSDGRVYDAEVVGTDPTYDLAVIKLVDAEGLTPIEFADSSDLNVGDETIAVGAPLGLSSTVTTGIVSALNRSIEIASAAAPDSDDTEGEGGGEQGEAPFFFDFGQGQRGGQAAESIKISVIQTDAAINPGNSGGALVDAEGKLIGINVAIASAGGSSGAAGSIGVGFAIPSNVVERITGELIENGTATHGLLGASVSAAAYVEGATMTGAYIQEIVEGGAAAEADLRVGDIVTGFNGFPITDSVDLTAQVRAAAAGSDATVTFVRDGETRTVEVTLGELP
ncbi:trypsin-like peptidase domain-containing protein [Microbacterium sp. NPDC055910]|uniref:S1C family serine protease n=1 Tax=Microbacterium sp. NPDC055910 TaxID=3345659 RepID=UPI0035DA15D8